MKQFDIAIIGGGPAGLYTYYLAQKNKLNVCLLEANNCLGGQPSILFPIKLIHDYPQYKEIRANDLMNQFINQIDDQSNIILNTSVSDVIVNYDGVEVLTNKEPVKAKYVVIATGGGFFKFNKIDGIEDESIHYCVKDLETYKNKKVVVCGGGDSAIDWAWELLTNNITKDLSLVHRRDEFRASGTKLEQVLSNVKVYLNKTSKVTSKNKLELTDKNDNTKTILDYDYCLVFFGQSYSLQDNKLLSHFNLDTSNRIVVDEACKTNINSIYAIGNVSSFNNKPKLIHVAVSDATKAINDIVGRINKHE